MEVHYVQYVWRHMYGVLYVETYVMYGVLYVETYV